MFAKIFICLSLIAICNGQILGFGTCKNPDAKQLFGVTNFAGKWYVIAKYFTNPAMNYLEKCDFVEYSVNTTTTVVSIKHKYWWNILNWEQEQSGQATFNGCPSEGKLSATLTNTNLKNSPYYILDTDHSTFAVVYACNPTMFFMKQEFLYVLARTRKMPEADLQKAFAAVDARKLRGDFLKFVQQDGCENLDPIPPALVNSVINVVANNTNISSTNITVNVPINTNVNVTVGNNTINVPINTTVPINSSNVTTLLNTTAPVNSLNVTTLLNGTLIVS